MRTILVGFDDSDASREALDLAARESIAAHGELVVLAVLESKTAALGAAS